ncbi:MAG: hypothetical protein EBS84_08580 [Proteobacteria bacterium]|nr:hypothetical protein [Verrucomicrobiota bacterium]NBU09056.1 hypothetical protein [Pseudomonadota bacterium]
MDTTPKPSDDEIIRRFDSAMMEARRLYLSDTEDDCQARIRGLVGESSDLIYRNKRRKVFPKSRFSTVFGMAKVFCAGNVRKQRADEVIWSVLRDSRYFD